MWKTLAKDTLIYGAGNFFFKFVSFAIFPIYANIFSVSDFGRMELVLTFAGLVSLFMNLGLNNSAQRFYWDPALEEKDRPALVSTGLYVLAVWASLICAAVLGVAYYFKGFVLERFDIPFAFVALGLIAAVPGQVVDYCLDTLRLHLAPWKFSALSAARNLLGVSVILVLILAVKLGLIGFFAGTLIAICAVTPVGLYFIKKDLGSKPRYALGREMVLFGYPFIFAGLAYWLFGYIDRWILGALTDTAEVGIYSIGFKFASIVVFCVSAFSQAWSPYAIKIYADRPDYMNVFSSVFSYLFFGLAVLGCVITLFSAEILRMLTPEAYWKAGTCLGFLVMGVVVQGTTQITAISISLAKRSWLLSIAAWVTAAANIVLNFLLIPYWGAVGAAVATFLSYILLTGMYLYWTQNIRPLPLEKVKIAAAVVVILTSLSLATFLNSIEWSIWQVALKLIFVASSIFAGFALKALPDLKTAMTLFKR